MARNKKPRKAYRPRHVGTPVNLRWAVATDRKTYLDAAPWQALAALKALGPTMEHVATLESATALLCEILPMASDLSDESRAAAAPVAEAGYQAVKSVIEREARTGNVGATGPELVAIGDALTLLDQALTIASRREHRDALRKMLVRSTGIDPLRAMADGGVR